MNITALGDIIAILKHAKTVQSKRTTDKLLQPERSVEVSPPIKKDPPPPPKIRNSITPPPKAPTKPEVSSRLGPPAPRDFVKARNTLIVDPADKKSGIFSRLAPVSSNPGAKKRSLDEDNSEYDLKRKRNSAPLSGSGSDDFSDFQRRIRAKHGEVGDDLEDTSGSSGGKFKRYMKVQTLADGSKVKSIVDPDDPILDEYEIKKQHLATGKRTFKTKPSPTAKLALRRRPMLSDDDNDNNDRPGPAKKPRNDRSDRNERNDRGNRKNGWNDRNNGRPERTNDRGGDRNDWNNDRGDGRNERQQHHCDICDKKFKGAQNLEDHNRAKHPPPPKDLRQKLGPKWQWPQKSKNKSGAEIRRRRQEKENSGGKNFFDCNNCHFTFN